MPARWRAQPRSTTTTGTTDRRPDRREERSRIGPHRPAPQHARDALAALGPERNNRAVRQHQADVEVRVLIPGAEGDGAGNQGSGAGEVGTEERMRDYALLKVSL